MANIKITDLTAYTDAASTDVLPIVDVGADVTKKIAIGDVVKAVPLGTAELPGLAFDGDPNSGVYSPGADQVAISTGGTGRLFVNSSGRVGIGTTSPGNSLEVVGKIESSGSLSGFNITRRDTSADAWLLYSADGALSFYEQSGSSEKARIDSSGRLLVGTSSSTSNDTLVLQGRSDGSIQTPNIRWRRNLANPASGSFLGLLSFENVGNNQGAEIVAIADGAWTDGSSHPTRLVFNTAASGSATPTERLRITSTGTLMHLGAGNSTTPAVQFNGSAPVNSLVIDSSGKLGLGTASPSVNLDVSGAGSVAASVASTSTNQFGQLRLQTNQQFVIGYGSTHSAQPNELSLKNNVGDLTFYTNVEERVRIDSSGRVGIGTTAPSRLLHCSGTGGQEILLTALTSGDVRFGMDVVGSTYNWIDSERSSKALKFGVDNTERVRIDSSGTFRVKGAGTAGVTDAVQLNGSAPSNSLVINSSGNLGLGTSSPDTNLEIALSGSSANGLLLSSDNVDTSARLFFQNATAGEGYAILQENGGLDFRSGATAGTSSGTQRVRIDSDGRLLVGTSSSRTGNNLQLEGTTGAAAGASFVRNEAGTAGGTITLGKSRGTTNGSFTVVQNNDALGSIIFKGADGTTDINGALIQAYVDGTPGANDMPGRLVFSTTADGASSPTERMRIDNAGQIVFNSATYGLRAQTGSAAGTTVQIFSGFHSATNVGTGTACIYIHSNGNVVNTNNSYGAISDIKLKENIVDANSQWDDLKALQVRNYNFKPETGYSTHTQIGLIAQEAELVSPGLVSESPDRDEEGNDLGTVTKSVNYSVLYMKAVKALQEAMERIEVLEAKVNALEGN